MCDIIEFGRGSPKHITVEFERDASLRATAVVIVATSPSGEEMGLKHLITDKGKFIQVGTPVDLIEGVDII